MEFCRPAAGDGLHFYPQALSYAGFQPNFAVTNLSRSSRSTRLAAVLFLFVRIYPDQSSLDALC